MAMLMGTTSQAGNEVGYEASYLDSMAIEMPAESGRPYLFSGQGESFFYGSTKDLAETGWMGLHYGPNKIIDDFIITINGKPLDRDEAMVTMKPHGITFLWPDSISLVISPVGVNRDDLMFNLRGLDKPAQIAFFAVFPSGTKITPIKRASRLMAQIYMIAGATDTVGVMFAGNEKYEKVEIQPTGEPGRFGDRKVIGSAWEDVTQMDLILIYGNSLTEIGDRFDTIMRSEIGPAELRMQWLLARVNESPFESDNAEINKAVNWAKISLGSLFSEDNNLLWAGLPWFNDGWARDTFISLPGAALVLGRYDVARNILLKYAKWQNTDPTSTDYGRVPNRARFGDIAYNTCDGTPWFVRTLYEYGLYSGDLELWKQMMAPGGVIEKSIEGTRKYHTDKLGLLVHGDAETWMDAVGPEGAWSPRGDRAVEIQVLWLTQIEAALEMAKVVAPDGPDPSKIAEWETLAKQLRVEIPKRYVRPDGLGLYDHLNSDGTPDKKIRSNQLWGITVPLTTLFNDEVKKSIVKTVRDSLVYRWGVASLAQTDEDFHPYHETSFYPKDAAYHMGIVWTWLSGPYKSASRVGWSVTKNELTQILDWGAPGTLSENLDAIPRDGAEWPRTSGTVSQAWSLAELLRTWYQDYIGLRPAYGEELGVWSFDPRIPVEWGAFSTTVMVGATPLTLNCKPVEGGLEATFSIDTSDDTKNVQIIVVSADNERIELSSSNPEQTVLLTNVPMLTGEEDEPMLQPMLSKNLKSIRPPDYLLLDGPLVTSKPEEMETVIEVRDPSDDDNGGSGYGYPTDSHFLPGILDLQGLRVSKDGTLARFELKFRALSDPGWHPEYGYQLTFATIAIRTGEKGQKRTRDIERNSGWKLSRKEAADRLIHVSGGFEIVDGSQEIIAAYHPDKTGYELGNVSTGIVSFTIPLELIGGDPSKWRVTVLAGAQDDHGGAGVGEFRDVNEEGGTWIGSGGRADSHNVYDWLKYPVE